MRHPKPAVAEGVCYGVSDVSLAEPITLDSLAHAPHCDVLVSSPLTRCRQVADVLAAKCGVAPVIDPRLREMDFGAWENRAWESIAREELDAWAADFLHARPHGGESVAMLKARVDDALAEHKAARGAVLIVTHAGVVKAALNDWRARVDFSAWVKVD